MHSGVPDQISLLKYAEAWQCGVATAESAVAKACVHTAAAKGAPNQLMQDLQKPQSVPGVSMAQLHWSSPLPAQALG